jgi:hypothetical protein
VHSDPPKNIDAGDAALHFRLIFLSFSGRFVNEKGAKGGFFRPDDKIRIHAPGTDDDFVFLFHKKLLVRT